MTEVAETVVSVKAAVDTAAPRVQSVTINQLVGYNMAWYRKLAGLTQEQFGRGLGGWTKVAVSAAERSWDGKRIRKFDADELVAIARVLEIPVPALFLPPVDAGTAVTYVLEEKPELEDQTLLTELLPSFLPSRDNQSPAADAFRKRLVALGASSLSEAGNWTALAEGIDVEPSEHDTQGPHRTALDPLIRERDELIRRIEDLRALEREYRSRLLAYMESQIVALRSEESSKARKFVLKKGSGGKYHFNLVAANGQVIATSETYQDKQSALRAIESVIFNASRAGIDDQAGE
jgi:uncharacterized protein YegP (UPF0339 family)/transcriptional regulator with XRE-family HTH domain